MYSVKISFMIYVHSNEVASIRSLNAASRRNEYFQTTNDGVWTTVRVAAGVFFVPRLESPYSDE